MRSLVHGAACAAVLTLAPFASAQNVWRVRASAPPGGDGLTWQTAFDSLQDALDVSAWPDEIWVARGRYQPDLAIDPTDPRSVTFWVPNGVRLYGGFAGNESALAERAGLFESTVLSGDIGVPGDSSDNAYHVVYLLQTAGLPPTNDIDGFVIEGGRADGGPPYDNHGGGVRCDNSGLRLSNCTLRDNFAFHGGGLYQSLGAVRVRWCTFENNTGSKGGGINARYATLFLFNSVIRDNVALKEGGGLYAASSWMNASSILVGSCELYDNSADRGGAIYIQAPKGVNSFPTNSTWVNCTVAYNTASEAGGAIFEEDGGVTPAKTRLVGSILWGDAAPVSPEIIGNLSVVKRCTITGGYAGNNLGLDPLFVDGPGRDFRLQAGSPCIDAAHNGFSPPDLADVDFDGNMGERAPLDLGGHRRFVDDPTVPDTGVGTAPLMDMGAHEVQTTQ